MCGDCGRLGLDRHSYFPAKFLLNAFVPVWTVVWIHPALGSVSSRIGSFCWSWILDQSSSLSHTYTVHVHWLCAKAIGPQRTVYKCLLNTCFLFINEWLSGRGKVHNNVQCSPIIYVFLLAESSGQWDRARYKLIQGEWPKVSLCLPNLPDFKLAKMINKLNPHQSDFSFKWSWVFSRFHGLLQSTWQLQPTFSGLLLDLQPLLFFF